MSGIFETQPSAPKRRRSVPRLIAAGALALLTGAIIAGCAATAPAAPAAPTAAACAPRPSPLRPPRPPHLQRLRPKAHPLGRLPVEPAARPR